MVADSLANATGFQLYLDQAYPPAVGQEVNDSVAELIAGAKTPEQVAAAHHRSGQERMTTRHPQAGSGRRFRPPRRPPRGRAARPA